MALNYSYIRYCQAIGCEYGVLGVNMYCEDCRQILREGGALGMRPRYVHTKQYPGMQPIEVFSFKETT